jgi:hypothetical protein
LTRRNEADIIFSGFADTDGTVSLQQNIILIQSRITASALSKKGTQNEKEKENFTYRIYRSRRNAFLCTCRMLGLFGTHYTASI